MRDLPIHRWGKVRKACRGIELEDGLALDNRTYLKSLRRRFHICNASLSILLAAVAVVMTRPATLAPVSWLYGTETALTGVDSSMSISALAALSWHAVTVTLIDANGCEIRLVAKLEARFLAIDTVIELFALVAGGDFWIRAAYVALIAVAAEDAVTPTSVSERRSESVMFYADAAEQ
jgi:hypothetical protein